MLEPGKLAVVLLVDGRPDRDIGGLANAGIVDGMVKQMRNGQIVIARRLPVPEPGQVR